METALDGIISVDNGNIHIRKCSHQLFGSEFLECDILRILRDIFYSGIDSGIFLKGNDSLLGKKQKCPRFICDIIRNSHQGSFRERSKVRGLSRIDPERLIMNRSDGDQIRSVLLIELFKIWHMLEIVGIQAALDHTGIRSDGILQLYDLKGDALFCQYGLGLLKDLCMRRDIGTDFDHRACFFGRCTPGCAGTSAGGRGKGYCSSQCE